MIEEGRIVDIYGPSGIRQYLRTTLGSSYSMLNFSIRVHEIIAEGGSAYVYSIIVILCILTH